MLRNEMHAPKTVLCLGAVFMMLAGLTSLVQAQERGPVRSLRTSHKVLSSSAQRVLFDSSAFETPGVPTPYSDRGYIISRRVESFSPETPNVMLYGKDGQKVREASIWFPESTRVAITSAAVTPDGMIVASGEADKGDGTRAPFIALANPSGKLTSVIRTKDFYPTYVCVAPDDTVWSYGSTWWDDINHRPLPGDLLRHFDFTKGQLAGYLPRSNFPEPSSHDAMTLMRCSSNGVTVFSGPENTLIQMLYADNAPRVYDASPPTGLWLGGVGILDSMSGYAVLINRERADDPTQGVYSLELDEAAKAVRWSPVEGAVGARTSPGIVVRLWGADGQYLVLGRANDPAGVTAVHWAMVSEK